ncbi:hypothetical protein OFO01_06730 [Campylobacter sp. JMF_01 NE2]|uniref:hypothetical protein n=1 Tax=unclassified Campylobacter TaxID=2593542 RepID=UPI0022E9B1EA|nr:MULTISPECIES: hypothetical protein [unclassified Campylobacter]MDA3053144.1 hypothetical protein [Campylobacter sp. JMF_03 NE3]MDA3067475.1 hypothetical protein [Campylobacter sp. JMF_01 NE2]
MNNEYDFIINNSVPNRAKSAPKTSEYISDEQNQILQNYQTTNFKEVNLSLNKLLMTYLVMMFVFLLTVPAIFIRNEIYYISRDIAELRTKHEVLLEENRALKNNIEFLRFKKEIIDAVNLDDKPN